VASGLAQIRLLPDIGYQLAKMSRSTSAGRPPGPSVFVSENHDHRRTRQAL
jgi:hypothetical protein